MIIKKDQKRSPTVVEEALKTFTNEELNKIVNLEVTGAMKVYDKILQDLVADTQRQILQLASSSDKDGEIVRKIFTMKGYNMAMECLKKLPETAKRIIKENLENKI